MLKTAISADFFVLLHRAKTVIITMRTTRILLIGLAFWAAACQSAEQQLITEIQQLEEQNEGEPNEEVTRDLIGKYRTYADSFPQQTERCGRYLYRAAGLEYRLQRFDQTIALLKQALLQHYEAPSTPDNVLLLGSTYRDALQNEVLATTVFQAAELAFPTDSTFMDKVPPGMRRLRSRLDTIKSDVYDEDTYQVNYRIANNYIEACELFSLILPERDVTPDVLFNAAEMARAVQAYSRAVELYARIQDRYPDYSRMNRVLFMWAYTLDDGLQDYDGARARYSEFIERFPGDDFADDAEASLRNLGKSPEELIREFEQKQQKGEELQ